MLTLPLSVFWCLCRFGGRAALLQLMGLDVLQDANVAVRQSCYLPLLLARATTTAVPDARPGAR